MYSSIPAGYFPVSALLASTMQLLAADENISWHQDANIPLLIVNNDYPDSGTLAQYARRDAVRLLPLHCSWLDIGIADKYTLDNRIFYVPEDLYENYPRFAEILRGYNLFHVQRFRLLPLEDGETVLAEPGSLARWIDQIPPVPHVPTGRVPLASLIKTAIADALGFLRAWCPAIAICLGKLVTGIRPNFRRA
jgi:hypothetical protein